MNIVKIKDVVVSQEDASWATLFNKYFKGKYVYCINWTYCIPIEILDSEKVIPLCQRLCKDININQYDPQGTANPWIVYGNDVDDILYDEHEEGINIPYAELVSEFGKEIEDTKILPIINFGDLNDWKMFEHGLIDWKETQRINSVDKLLKYNECSIEDITIDQVKKFRSWLATEILSFDIDKGFDYSVRHMLKYYKCGMYDKTVKALSEFGSQTVAGMTLTTTGSTCGCANNASAASLVSASLTGTMCDALTIYRHNIYLKMVETFSSLDFWLDNCGDPEFLKMFKTYIDSIIKLNLPLTAVTWQSEFVDCSCQITGNTQQDLAISRLRKLSTALGYMIDDNISGHKTYITSAFAEWAKYLYEIMEWTM